jgi:hypothetical protein
MLENLVFIMVFGLFFFFCKNNLKSLNIVSCPVCTGKNDIENGVFQTLDKQNQETTVAKEKHKRP